MNRLAIIASLTAFAFLAATAVICGFASSAQTTMSSVQANLSASKIIVVPKEGSIHSNPHVVVSSESQRVSRITTIVIAISVSVAIISVVALGLYFILSSGYQNKFDPEVKVVPVEDLKTDSNTLVESSDKTSKADYVGYGFILPILIMLVAGIVLYGRRYSSCCIDTLKTPAGNVTETTATAPVEPIPVETVVKAKAEAEPEVKKEKLTGVYTFKDFPKAKEESKESNDTPKPVPPTKKDGKNVFTLKDFGHDTFTPSSFSTTTIDPPKKASGPPIKKIHGNIHGFGSD